MKKTNKNINIALIFILIIGAVCTETCYSEALRVPLNTEHVKEQLIRENLNKIESYPEQDLFAESVPTHVSILEILNAIDVIKGNLLYWSIGVDYFTSYFATTFGINYMIRDDEGGGLGYQLKLEHGALEQMEKEAINKRGLSPVYEGRPKRIRLFKENNFDYEKYFSKILDAGGLDVILIKGLTHWAGYYGTFPGGEFNPNITEFSMEQLTGAEEKKLKDSIKDLIRKTSVGLLKEGGYIVIAHEDDLWIKDFIMKELRYSDYLAQPKYRKIKEVLSKNYQSYKGFFVTPDAGLVSGKYPVLVFKKPYKDLKFKIHHLCQKHNI